MIFQPIKKLAQRNIASSMLFGATNMAALLICQMQHLKERASTRGIAMLNFWPVVMERRSTSKKLSRDRR